MASIVERNGRFSVVYNYIDHGADVYSHIIDADRRRNAELFEEAFYSKKNLTPNMKENKDANTMTVPEGVDPEVLQKVLASPEMSALLMSLAKSMKGS